MDLAVSILFGHMNLCLPKPPFDSCESLNHPENSEEAETVFTVLPKSYRPVRIDSLTRVTFPSFSASPHLLQKSL